MALQNIKAFHQALRECGRSERLELRTAAMKLIAISRQGKLAYVLSENLHDPREELSKAAVEAGGAGAVGIDDDAQASEGISAGAV